MDLSDDQLPEYLARAADSQQRLAQRSPLLHQLPQLLLAAIILAPPFAHPETAAAVTIV
jgi:hypothetical protein